MLFRLMLVIHGFFSALFLLLRRDGVLSREEMLAYFKKVNFMRALRESFVHDFVETTYLSPTFCAHCKGLVSYVNFTTCMYSCSVGFKGC